MANLKDILTLGIFDYSKIVDLLTGSIKKSATTKSNFLARKSTPVIINPEGKPGRPSIKLFKECDKWLKWIDFYQCADELYFLTFNMNVYVAKDCVDRCEGCPTNPYDPAGDGRPFGGYPHSEPSFPMPMDRCQNDTCLKLYGNEDCNVYDPPDENGNPVINDEETETAQFIVSLLCYQQSVDQYAACLDCFNCHADLKDKIYSIGGPCGSPSLPSGYNRQPTSEEVQREMEKCMNAGYGYQGRGSSESNN